MSNDTRLTVPLVQERGIYPTDYEGATLGDHLGVPAQHGIDPRIAGDNGLPRTPSTPIRGPKVLARTITRSGEPHAGTQPNRIHP